MADAGERAKRLLQRGRVAAIMLLSRDASNWYGYFTLESARRGRLGCEAPVRATSAASSALR